MATNPSQSQAECLSREAVLERVIRIVSEQCGFPVEEIQESSLLFDDLGYDSLMAIETVIELEEEFDIELPDQMMEPVRTVGELVDGLLRIVVSG